MYIYIYIHIYIYMYMCVCMYRYILYILPRAAPGAPGTAPGAGVVPGAASPGLRWLILV